MRTGCTQNQFCLESLEGRLLLSADPALIAADPLAIASPTAEIAKLFGDASESQNLSALTSAKEAFDMFEDMGIFAPADKGDVSLTEKGSSEGSTESSEAKTAKATTAPAPSAESSTSEVVSVAPESQTGSKATELMAETLKVANPPPHVVSTVTLFGAPDWRDQGPGPISSAGSSVGATFAGAINGIAADAFNANLMFVATVNGGVWRSMNATATTPQWTTATDQFPSLSMGSVAISPLDRTGAVRTASTPLVQTVVYASHVRNSSGGADGGPLSGILKSADGGNTWVELNQLVGQNIFKIIPTTMTTPSGQVVLAATSGGLFRSINGGTSWTLISGSSGIGDSLDNNANGTVDEPGEVNLPGGNVNDLVADSGTANSFYTAIPSQGIFRSTNGGQNWVVVNSNLTGINPYGAAQPNLIAGSSFAQLAVHNSAGNNVVYAALVPGAPLVTMPPTPAAFPQVFRSTNQGGAWTPMDNFPETFIGQNSVGDMAADPTNPNIVFLAGLQGAVAGDVFRGNFGAAAGTQWQAVDGGGANGTAPHPDIRALAFDQNGDLVCSNDGGIYRLVNPNGNPGPAPTRQWFAINGDIRPTEFYSVAYDSLNNAIFGGTQDNGTPRQREGAPPADPLFPLDWPEARGSDGGIVAVDNDQIAHSGITIQYTSTQYFSVDRRTVNNLNIQTSAAAVGLGVNNTSGRALGGPGTLPNPRPSAFPGGALVFDATLQFTQLFVLNAVNPNRMLVGTNFLYESLDVAMGNNFTSLGGLVDLRNNGLDDDGDMSADPDADEWQPNGSLGTISALAYGGRLGGVDAPDVIYAGSSGGTGNGQLPNGQLFRRNTNSTNTLADFTTLTNYPGSTPRDIVLDPDDWQRGYVVDSGGQVFHFINGGTNAADWTNISGALTNPGRLRRLTTDLRSIELFTPTSAPGDDVVLVGGLGGVFRTIDPQDGANALWTEFGVGMPNAITKDLHYDVLDHVLLAGTYGRGAWIIPDANLSLFAPGGVLQIFGDTNFVGQDDTIRLVRDANNPSLLDVFLNGDFSQYQLSTIQQINVFGLGGNDTLIVDSSNGLIDVPLGTRYYGDGGRDGLQLLQTGGTSHMSDTYSVGSVLGSGTSMIVGRAASPLQFQGTQTVFFEDLSPVLDLVPAATLTIKATPADNAINYTVGSLVTNGMVTIDEHESIEFANKTSLEINAGAGRDSINLNNRMTPTGLTGLTVSGGDDTVGDDLVLNGLASTLGIDTSTGTVTGASGAGGNVSVSYATMETLTVVAGASNRLSVRGSVDYTVNPGARNDEGTVQADALSIEYRGYGVGRSLQLNGTGELVINGTTTNDTMSVASGTGDVLMSRRATIERAGTLSALVLNGLEGKDIFYVTGPQPYTTIEVAGGSGTSDLAKLTGNGTALTLEVEEDAATVTGGGLGTVRLSGVALATLNAANGNLASRGTAQDDEVEVTPVGLNSGRLTASALAGMVSFSNTGTFSVNLLGGQDALRVRGSPGSETIVVSGTGVEVVGREAVNYSEVEHLEVLSMAGSDVVQVTPGGIPVLVDGGDPIATAPGDLLTILTGGAPLTLNPGPESDEGSFNVAGKGPVSFDHVESFSVTGGGPLVVNGTNAPDAISLIARDASTHAGADGVRDFTVSINGTFDFLFIDVAIVTVQALGGSDEVVLRTPAPNNADWDVDVTVNGGAPSASDRLVIETPGAAPESATFTPSGVDAGSVLIVEANPLNGTVVTLTAVEELVYDGEADQDHVTVIGNAGADRTVHRPGATDDSGQLRINTWLALDYQSLGAGAELLSDGAGGNNTLVYDGTEGADVFGIERTLTGGQVNLNDRLALRTVNTQSLIVQGFGGDDAVTLVPAIQASPYANITVNGGAEASSSGDVLNLVGSNNADLLTISGRRVSGGGVTVDGTGIEETRLDGLGGVDQITYQGVAGLSEALNLIGSGSAGSSKLVVAGVATYTLTHAELFEAHANDGAAGDIDSLRFTGTNQSDVMNIDLNAAGTVADPILEFRDVTGANLLLTLVNYTGFRTLNVFGEDGQDFFNVYTGGDVGRELFVDGGLPAGKRRTRPDDTTDELRVYVVKAPTLPRVTNNAETQNQNSGFIEVLYDNGTRFPIQYDNMEFIDIVKII